MGLYKHGATWWFEYRTRSPYTRTVRNTGFRIDDPSGKKMARQVYEAYRMGVRVRPKREAMEAILAAIYETAKPDDAMAIELLWAAYEEWFRGKHKQVADKTWIVRQQRVGHFVSWCSERNIISIVEVSVVVAREYVAKLTREGRANKTVRNIAQELSSVWEAIGQMQPCLHNPWKAACPANDGSSVRKEMFTADEVERILDAAKEVGHDWYLASMIALHTGLRYGNVATMQIEDIDFENWIFGGIHRKTMHSSGAEIFVPVAKRLRPLLEPYRGKCGFLLPEHGIMYTRGAKPQPMDVPFAVVLAKAGIVGKQYTFHSFRHTANSRMAEAGVPSEIRQILCGWTNDAMARHYDHAKHLGELTDAIAKI